MKLPIVGTTIICSIPVTGFTKQENDNSLETSSNVAQDNTDGKLQAVVNTERHTPAHTTRSDIEEKVMEDSICHPTGALDESPSLHDVLDTKHAEHDGDFQVCLCI